MALTQQRSLVEDCHALQTWHDMTKSKYTRQVTSVLDLQAGLMRRFIPLFDRVLVERLVADTVSLLHNFSSKTVTCIAFQRFAFTVVMIPFQKTKGGVLLPEKSLGKMMEGTVVSIGEGTRDKVYN